MHMHKENDKLSGKIIDCRRDSTGIPQGRLTMNPPGGAHFWEIVRMVRAQKIGFFRVFLFILMGRVSADFTMNTSDVSSKQSVTVLTHHLF